MPLTLRLAAVLVFIMSSPELKLNEIPRLLVFNKIDRVDSDTLTAMQRETRTQTGADSLGISANNPTTLTALLEKIETATRVS